MNGKKHLALLGLALSLSSCAVFEHGGGSPAGSASATTAPGSDTRTGAATASSQTIATLPADDGDNEQQRLIDEINRVGQDVNLPGYTENPPTAVNPEAEDIVELNYEQADLRVILEELAEAVDATSSSTRPSPTKSACVLPPTVRSPRLTSGRWCGC